MFDDDDRHLNELTETLMNYYPPHIVIHDSESEDELNDIARSRHPAS